MAHFAEVEITPARFEASGAWLGYACSCGAWGDGYPTVSQARKAAQQHMADMREFARAMRA